MRPLEEVIKEANQVKEDPCDHNDCQLCVRLRRELEEWEAKYKAKEPDLTWNDYKNFDEIRRLLGRTEGESKSMTFSERNRQRCESPSGFNHSLESWTLSDWVTATVGEIGEAANIVKKLNRVRDGIPGNSVTAEELRDALADELADTAIYLDLLTQAAGFDLETIREAKFAKSSIKIGYKEESAISVTKPPAPSAAFRAMRDLAVKLLEALQELYEAQPYAQPREYGLLCEKTEPILREARDELAGEPTKIERTD